MYKRQVTLGTDIYGNVTRIDNLIAGFSDKRENCKEKLKDTEKQLANAEQEVKEPFTREEELQKKSQRLKELDTLLSFDEKDLSVEDNGVSENADKKDAAICL